MLMFTAPMVVELMVVVAQALTLNQVNMVALAAEVGHQVSLAT